MEDYTLPAVELGAHVAPLGLTFYTGKRFPKKYHSSLIVAEHGSWKTNRKMKPGVARWIY
jgi:glucose/arabinose dehydrogenase